MANENFERIDTVKGEFFTYVVGHFKAPDVYAIGVMDLNDTGARAGGESETVFYFMITPDEYAWYKEDPEKLEDLAQKFQIKMPKNRFFAAISAKKMDQKEMNALIQHNLVDETLDDDEVFENWAAGLRERTRQQAAAAKIARDMAAQIPKNPFNEARHKLALHQKEIRNRDEVIKEHRENLKNLAEGSQERKDAEAWINEAQAGRMEAARGGKELEDALGNRIFTSSSIFVAMDTCWKDTLPMINAASGMVCVFSTKQIADHYVELVTKKHQLYPSIREIQRNDIKNFLRELEMLGVITLLVDDGTEPVRILLKNIIPRLDRGYIEMHNAGIRNLIVRDMQVSAAIQKHGSEMEEEWRLNQIDLRSTIDRSMLQDLGNSVLFVPCGIPAKPAKTMAGHYVYTEEANKRIHDLCAAEKLASVAMNRPGFTGRHIVLRGGAQLPLRMVKVNDDKNMMIAFTSREEAMTFIAQNRDMKTDTVVALSLDEISKVAGTMEGVMVDPHKLMLILNKEIIDKAISLRSEKKLIFNHNLNKKPGEAAANDVPAGKTE